MIANLGLLELTEPEVFVPKQLVCAMFRTGALVFDWMIKLGNSSRASTKISLNPNLFPDCVVKLNQSDYLIGLSQKKQNNPLAQSNLEAISSGHEALINLFAH